MSSHHPADPLAAAGQPAEKRADIRFGSKDEALRHDVHDLGVVIGQLLTEQGGAQLLRQVEAARRAAIEAREGDAQAAARLEQQLQSLPPTDARDFIRAFSTYFQVVNTAEQVHRIRRRRDYLKDGQTRQPGGLEDTLWRLRDAGVGLSELDELFARLHIEPVLTAHPTEPTRRTILRRQQDIVRRLIDMLNPTLTPGEKAADFASIRADITTIWQTDEHPGAARRVADELEHVLFFLTEVIYRAIPVFYENLEQALAAVYGAEPGQIRLPVMIRFASWIGGDMLGRPEISARTLRETLARHRTLILDRYFRECQALAEKLSQTTTRVGVSAPLSERIRNYSAYFPNIPGQIPARHREMPYRVFLRLVMARLQSTHDEGQYPYESPDDLLADVRLIAESLGTHHGRHAGMFAVQRLVRRIETFGFHLMTLDVHQDAAVNRAVVGRCLGEENWLVQPTEYRIRRLRAALDDNESPCGEPDNEARRAIGMFQAISFCRRRFGERAVGPYIVGMTSGVDDLLSVILLARWGELRRRSGSVPLDIAPALETPAALARADSFLQALLAEPAYREHLEARGMQQKILLGYDDRNTVSDLASARWTLYRAQAALQRAADAAGIELRLFHGRAGSINPGGGKTHATIGAAAEGTVRGRCRILEPGELIAGKYGIRAIALRTLEQMLGATISATRNAQAPGPDVAARRAAIMTTLCAAAAGRYRALVEEAADFPRYFRLATPVDIIRQMQGLPPDEERLLAEVSLPWALAWTQSRNLLPAWYGIGSGLEAAIARHGLPELRSLAGEWPLLRTLIGDVELALAKSDLDIAARYSMLAGPLHEQFFPLIHSEFTRTLDAILQIKDQKTLLERNGTLSRSIRLRNPYVDPMSLLQVELLRRWRAGGRGDGALLDALLASVNGIARGLQDAV